MFLHGEPGRTEVSPHKGPPRFSFWDFTVMRRTRSRDSYQPGRDSDWRKPLFREIHAQIIRTFSTPTPRSPDFDGLAGIGEGGARKDHFPASGPCVQSNPVFCILDSKVCIIGLRLHVSCYNSWYLFGRRIALSQDTGGRVRSLSPAVSLSPTERIVIFYASSAEFVVSRKACARISN